MCHGTCVEFRGQFAGVDSLPPPCRLQRLKSRSSGLVASIHRASSCWNHLHGPLVFPAEVKAVLLGSHQVQLWCLLPLEMGQYCRCLASTCYLNKGVFYSRSFLVTSLGSFMHRTLSRASRHFDIFLFFLFSS